MCSRVRLVGLALGFALAVCGARSALAGPTEEAAAHFRKGKVHYQLSEYREALHEFKDAYRLKQDPVFLFNIAQCHRLLGEASDALTFYRRYVREWPDAPNRQEVDRRIRELESKAPAAPPPPGGPAGGGGGVVPASGQGPVAPAQPAPGPPPINLQASEAPPPAASLASQPSSPGADARQTPAPSKKWWIWMAAGAVLIAGAAVSVAVLADRDPYCAGLPDCIGIR